MNIKNYNLIKIDLRLVVLFFIFQISLYILVFFALPSFCEIFPGHEKNLVGAIWMICISNFSLLITILCQLSLQLKIRGVYNKINDLPEILPATGLIQKIRHRDK